MDRFSAEFSELLAGEDSPPSEAMQGCASEVSIVDQDDHLASIDHILREAKKAEVRKEGTERKQIGT